MAKDTSVYERLLSLFPVKVLRDYWETKAYTRGDVVKEVANTYTIDSIEDFVEQYLGCTKQHIYIFSCNGLKFESLEEAPSFCDSIVINDNSSEIMCLVDLTYKVFLENPDERIDLEFLWPIQIHLQKNILIVKMVVMEKNVSTYFENRNAKVLSRSIAEDLFIAKLVEDLQLKHLDLNKGIKTLWNSREIDAENVRYRKEKSVSGETMDEGYTVRENCPDEYQKAMRAPLLMTAFKIYGDYKMSHFSTNPTEGVIRFPMFSENGETERLVRHVLESN